MPCSEKEARTATRWAPLAGLALVALAATGCSREDVAPHLTVAVTQPPVDAGPPPVVVLSVAAGPSYGCAAVHGSAQCWGYDSDGELGNGATQESNVPVVVQGLGPDSGVTAVTAGAMHGCALVNGGVRCWGYNQYGQLGNGSTDQSLVPVAVVGIGVADSGVQALAAGESFSCALVAGGVRCWGDGEYGQLGNGATSGSDVPVGVTGLGAGSGALGLAAGQRHACAVVNGGVRCWGYNQYGQLGSGSTAESNAPVLVRGLGGPNSGVEGVAAGASHSCAVVSGGVQCWGANGHGQLGNGSDAGSDVPVMVKGLGPDSGVTAVAAGDNHSCAIVAGGVECWGDNQNGQVGDFLTADHPLPVAVEDIGEADAGVLAIAAGGAHSCAWVNDAVECWGDNQFGQLGNGSTNEAFGPVLVAPWAP